MTYRFKGDKWNHTIGSQIPDGAEITVLRYFPRRRMLVSYNGQKILTMLWNRRTV